MALFLGFLGIVLVVALVSVFDPPKAAPKTMYEREKDTALPPHHATEWMIEAQSLKRALDRSRLQLAEMTGKYDALLAEKKARDAVTPQPVPPLACNVWAALALAEVNASLAKQSCSFCRDHDHTAVKEPAAQQEAANAVTFREWLATEKKKAYHNIIRDMSMRGAAEK
jgi:hypothetical protein